MSANNVLTVISPDDGRRFRVNIKGDIGRLTIGRLKQCLAAAPSCTIPAADQIIKLSGAPLTCDEEVCAAYGIMNGTTLILEHRNSVNPATNHAASFVSPHRQALEYRTLRQQEEILGEEVTGYNNTLQGKIDRLQDQVEAAERKKAELEREKGKTERELARIREQEAFAAMEKRRLSQLREREAQRVARRAADLAARREQLKVEEEATRAVALQKLDNERRRALLEQQRAEYEEEKERLRKEREEYERRAKTREMNIRAKEIEIEHQVLAADRDRKEVEFNKLVSRKNRLMYYERMGRPPPPELLQEEMNKGNWPVDDSSVLPLSGLDNESSGWEKPPAMNGMPPTQQWPPNPKQPCGKNEAQHPPGLIKSEDATPANNNVRKTTMMMPDNDNSVLDQSVKLYDARENAIDNLICMGKELGLEDMLQFDESNTCVISVDGKYTLLVTFDATTERLYLYSTLMTNIPAEPEVRLRVYEFLMEGALLGREMCGGGVGASIKNDFILLSTSIYLPTSLPTTLGALTPHFVMSLEKWREKLAVLLKEIDLQQKTGPIKNGNGAAENATGLKSRSKSQEQLLRHTTALPRSSGTNGAKGVSSGPVIGVEATDSVTINGVPSHYSNGVLVVDVTGPAARAGIETHDCIKKVNQKRVTSLKEFQREVSRLPVGAMAPFVVERGGVLKVFSVKVGSA